MAAIGYTPIQLYYSTTASAVPVNTSLENGELAINITDGKLYYKNNSGTVTLLAGATGAIAPITTNGVVYVNSSGQATSGSALTFDGTNLSCTGNITSGGTLQALATVQSSSGADLSLNANGANRDVIVKVNGTEQARFVGSTGNLGIGTNSPTTFSGFKTLELANSSGNAISLVTGTSVIAQTISSNTNSAVYMGARSNHPLYLTTNDTARATFDTAGNLGLGTSSPNVKLQVAQSNATAIGNGSTYLGLGATENGVGGKRLIGFGYKSTNNYYPAYFGFVETFNAGTTYGDLAFYTRSVNTDTEPTERLRIASSGAIGLSGANYGTSGQVLTSQGSGSPPIWAAGGGGGGSPAGSTGQFQYNNAGSFAAAPSMMETNGTTVTFSPTSTNSLNFFRYVNNSTDSIRWFNETTGPYYYSLENYTSSPVRGLVWGNNFFNPAGWSQVMTFMNMNVAIGTKTPGAKFHVSDGSNLYFGDAGGVGWSGNPIIRNPANSGYLILMNGSTGGVGLTAGSGSWTSISDERHKTNLVPIENGLSKVMTLRAVTGRYVVDNEGASRAFLIAQDVQKVLPEAVSIADDGRMWLGYTDTIPLLVAAIKELKAEFDAYKLSHP